MAIQVKCDRCGEVMSDSEFHADGGRLMFADAEEGNGGINETFELCHECINLVERFVKHPAEFEKVDDDEEVPTADAVAPGEPDAAATALSTRHRSDSSYLR